MCELRLARLYELADPAQKGNFVANFQTVYAKQRILMQKTFTERCQWGLGVHKLFPALNQYVHSPGYLINTVSVELDWTQDLRIWSQRRYLLDQADTFFSAFYDTCCIFGRVRRIEGQDYIRSAI